MCDTINPLNLLSYHEIANIETFIFIWYSYSHIDWSRVNQFLVQVGGKLQLSTQHGMMNPWFTTN